MNKETKPLSPTLWHILVAPHEPKEETEGGIIIAESTRRREEITTTIGKVIDVGPAALDGKTESGIVLSNFATGVSSSADLIGKWVMFQRHTGNKFRLRHNKRMLILLTATEILAIVDDPQAFETYA